MADIVVAEQRTIIKFYVKLRKSITEIKEDLQEVYREAALVNLVFINGGIDLVTVESPLDTRRGHLVTQTTGKKCAVEESLVMKIDE